MPYVAPPRSKEEIDAEVKRPVVAELLRMMEFRNAHPAFDGTFELETSDDDKLVIVRRNGDAWAKLSADFKAKKFEITYTEDGEDIRHGWLPVLGCQRYQ